MVLWLSHIGAFLHTVIAILFICLNVIDLYTINCFFLKFFLAYILVE